MNCQEDYHIVYFSHEIIEIDHHHFFNKDNTNTSVDQDCIDSIITPDGSYLFQSTHDTPYIVDIRFTTSENNKINLDLLIMESDNKLILNESKYNTIYKRFRLTSSMRNIRRVILPRNFKLKIINDLQSELISTDILIYIKFTPTSNTLVN